jgi:hypothetical protein
MGVPHPPGAPFFTLLGRFFIMLMPFGDNPAIKMNFISVLASALAVMFLYLIVVMALKIIKGELKNITDEIIVYGSAVIGALSYAFSDSFWFSAVESEVYAGSIFFMAFVVWLAMHWYTTPLEEKTDRYLLLIAYMMGLSIGVHQLSLLCYFFVAWLVYFKMTETITMKNMLIFMAISPLLFFIIYPGIVQWLPSMLDGTIESPIKVTDSGLLQIFPIIITLAIVYGIYYTQKQHKKALNMAFSMMLLIVIGYTTYAIVVIRANDNPPLNMGNPSTAQSFVDFMERKQYGEPPPITKRRHSQQPEHQKNYKNYKSDWDFFWTYQLGHMYFRYLGWNFIGRAGDIQDAPVILFKEPTTSSKEWPGWSRIHGWPVKLYGIPFIIGLFGLFYHFRKDWKVSIALLSLFIVSGIALIVYFNVPEPQPRERDYFVVGSFFVFSAWIGLGASGIAEFLRKILKGNYASHIGIGLIVLAVPVNMLLQNFPVHDRSLNYSAWDSGYNILQSCKKDAILFTAGDNDTYPLWYLQNAEGVRRDIRIVNLSLVNIDWYVLQLKNSEPFGAKKVPISMSDDEIKVLGTNYYAQLPPPPAKLPAVPKSKWEEYGITDTSQIGDMTFNIPPVNQFQGQKVIRMQDIIIYDILQTGKWERPVYFALTSGTGERIGLEAFLDLQGMALEVTPVKKRLAGGRFGINQKVFEQQLLSENVQPSKEFQRGFIFHNYNNPKIFMEEQAQDILDTYRALYAMNAREIANSDKEKANKYITIMEQRMPYSVIPIRYDLLLDILDIAMYLNDEEKIQYYAKYAEEEANKKIARNPKDVESISVLSMIYERTKQYEKALGIYNKYLEFNPNDVNVKNRIAIVQSLMKGDTTKK